jgi:transcriptional regulator with XRE-family HTH domain
MQGGELIREARKRAGLTQVELAERLGTTQPQIARWENGKTSPSFRAVVEAIRACGLDLDARIVTADLEHRVLIDDALRHTPSERMDHLTQAHASIERLAAAVRPG